ncbi:hypothetical protein BGX34_005587, partial [Mortierella sp. NVP85]
KVLELANVYLENAFSATDPDIALVLCHDTQVSLSQAKKSVKRDKDQLVTEGIAIAYIGLGKLLEERGYVDEAEENFKKAKKQGGNKWDLSRSADTYRPSNIKGTLHSAGRSQGAGLAESSALDQRQSKKSSGATSTVLAGIFVENVSPSDIAMKLPEPDERLENTPQLARCLSLLAVQSPDTELEPTVAKWIQTIKKDTEEQERLIGLSTGVIRAFKREEIKDAK